MSIFWKQFIPSFATLFIALFLFTLFVIGQLEKYDHAQTEKDLIHSANLVIAVLEPSLSSNNTGQIQPTVIELGEKSGIRITVMDNEGTVLGETDKNPREMDNHSERPEVKEAISGRKGQSSRFSNTLQEDHFYVALPVKGSSGTVDYVVRTSLPQRSLRENIINTEKNIIYASLLIAALSALALYFLSRPITRTLKSLIGISEELAHGNLNVQIPIAKKKGELSKISVALNQMTAKLNELFKQLSNEKNQLEAVLGAMSEGVMVISNQGNAVIVNQALKNMFSINGESVGKSYWEILRNREVTEVIEKVLSERNPETKEIFYLYPEERYYLLNVIPLDSPEKEVIAVMFDITDFKRLEKIKADFIANVSHELRTPLTAIKGYSETLEEGAYENTEDLKHFIGIIKRHTDRLINIVSDLLVLSEVESRDYLSGSSRESEFEWVDVEEIITSSLEAIKSKASNKALALSFEDSSEHHTVKGNRFLLEQMFVNIIDNAVKYTPEGGSIGIELATPPGFLQIKVSDTGIGIPKEHLPRIFERFYRVDKTRSRKIGGTGLGLSIVKHIVILHGGSVEVDSEEGKGSSFTILLPR